MKVDFYVLKSNALEERLLMACRLVQKGHSAGYRILIVADSQVSLAIDRLLWTFRPQSFIPHKIATLDTLSCLHHYPVILSEVMLNSEDFDVVINLSDSPISLESNQGSKPDNVSNIRLIEIVIQEPSVLSSTRTHYLHYKKMGYLLSTITL